MTPRPTPTDHLAAVAEIDAWLARAPDWYRRAHRDHAISNEIHMQRFFRQSRELRDARTWARAVAGLAVTLDNAFHRRARERRTG